MFKRFKLRRKAKKLLSPKMKEIKQQLPYLERIEVETDEETQKILDYISSDRKLVSLKCEYDHCLNQVKDHNLDVEDIKISVSMFDYDSFLSDPFDKDIRERIDKYYNIAGRINAYKDGQSRYKEFKKQITDLYLNIDSIQREYSLYNQLKDIYSLDDRYYSIRESNSLVKKADQIKNERRNYGRHYDFDSFADLKKLVEEQNEKYVEEQIKIPIFDDVNGRSMDRDQRVAAVTEEKNLLTIAAAGSGKTLTICGKVKFLLEEKKVDPNNILVLSYSRKSAVDLQGKIEKINGDIRVSTFHKLGLDIIKKNTGTIPLVEEQFDAIIESFFRDELPNRTEDAEMILSYLSLYSQPSSDKKYQDKGELYEELKSEDYTTLKDTLRKSSLDYYEKVTMKKELVKSYEELTIANFLFLNGVDYEYEAPYKYKVSTSEKRQYLPDFHIKGTDIYIEHYGVNRNFKCPQYPLEEEREYLETMRWKRETHRKYKTTCIETYSYEFSDGTIFGVIKEKLIQNGIKLKRISKEEMFDILNSVYGGNDYKSFINLLKSFISLYKARYENEEAFDELKKTKFVNNYEKKRECLFIDIAKNIYLYYREKLKKDGKIDFDDMILQSTKLINQTEGFTYKYVFVDEFQDISFSRLKLLQAVVNKGDADLFAVGDDYQSIYRFAGCDVDIFVNFDKYFNDTKYCYIPTTHRNSKQLQDIAEAFVSKNKHQIVKHIQSDKFLHHPIRILYYRDNREEVLNMALKSIYDMDNEANILLLGRNKSDIEDYLGLTVDCRYTKGQCRVFSAFYPSLNISFSTVHSSKGLEEDYVILINAEDRKTGFPNKIEDDPILNLLLSSKDNYPYAEERRLFYVALTRTRSYTYILVNEKRPSPFMAEIANDCEPLNEKSKDERVTDIHCPKCKSGILIEREKDGRKFYACSNYPYCKYTINDAKAVRRNLRCKRCGDFMVERNGRHSRFYGCHSYPKCNYTEEIPDKKTK